MQATKFLHKRNATKERKAKAEATRAARVAEKARLQAMSPLEKKVYRKAKQQEKLAKAEQQELKSEEKEDSCKRFLLVSGHQCSQFSSNTAPCSSSGNCNDGQPSAEVKLEQAPQPSFYSRVVSWFNVFTV